MIIQEPPLSGLSLFAYYVSSVFGLIGAGEIISIPTTTAEAGPGEAGGGSGLL